MHTLNPNTHNNNPNNTPFTPQMSQSVIKTALGKIAQSITNTERVGFMAYALAAKSQIPEFQLILSLSGNAIFGEVARRGTKSKWCYLKDPTDPKKVNGNWLGILIARVRHFIYRMCPESMDMEMDMDSVLSDLQHYIRENKLLFT